MVRFSRRLLPVSVCLITMSAFLLSDGMSAIAMAGTIGGFMEWNYSRLDSRSQDAAGLPSRLNNDNFSQRYNLSLMTNPLPLLRLTAGGLFEQQKSWTDVAAARESSLTTWQPTIDLSLSNALYSAGLGYSRREESVSTSGSAAVKRVNENYRALLGWRPIGLPTLDLQMSRNNTFDPSRLIEDSTTDRATLGLRYLPRKDVELNYRFVVSDGVDNLQGLEVQELSHTGRVGYSGQFFDRRVAVFSNYNVSRQDMTTSTSGAGEVDFPLNPLFGLASTADTPLTDTLLRNQVLVDGVTTVGSGINIGMTVSGGNRLLSMGIDFVTETELNHLTVWTDRELPPAIAAAFSWEIYTSSDNVTWSLWRSIGAAPFGPFQNRFDLRFDSLRSRYVKVVTRPLSQVAATLVPTFRDPERIFVTELQAIMTRPASEARGETSRTSHLYSLDVKAKILENLPLYYNGSLSLTAAGEPSEISYTISNGLSLEQRLNDIFSVSSRVAREDIHSSAGQSVGYAYNASLRATPLKNLSDTLVYSGRTDIKPAGTATTNSFYLFNTAELYRGVNMNLGGGFNFGTGETGASMQGSNLLFGLSLVPHRLLTMNVNYSLNRSSQSGGGAPDSSSSSQRGEISAAWRPFTTLYLFAGVGFLDQQTGKMDVTQNYGVNWSPFPDGALQFNFAFSENMRTVNSEQTRLITPSLSWQVTRRILFDLAYPMVTTTSALGESNVKIISSNLRLSF